MTITAAIEAPDLSDSAVDELIARIDEHLASMPTERELISVDDHTDMLLDIRLLAAKGRPASPQADNHTETLLVGDEGQTIQ